MSPIILTDEELPDPAETVSRFANRIARHRATGGALDQACLVRLLLQSGHRRATIDEHLPAAIRALRIGEGA